MADVVPGLVVALVAALAAAGVTGQSMVLAVEAQSAVPADLMAQVASQ